MSTLDVPVAIAGPVNLPGFWEAIACAGVVSRFDANRHLLVIEPAASEIRSRVEARLGMAWWNGLTRAERAYWLDVAGSTVPADAWRAFQAGAPPP